MLKNKTLLFTSTDNDTKLEMECFFFYDGMECNADS